MVMPKINNVKILIVGLTSVLALSNFHKNDLRKEKVQNETANVRVSANLITPKD